MDDTRSQLLRGAAEFPQGCDEVGFELNDAVGSAVRKGPLREVPDPFVRIEFCGIGGERLEPEPRKPAANLANRITLVDLAVVPENDHRTPKVAKKVTEEVAHGALVDVLLHMEVVVKTEPSPEGTHRNPRDHRDLVSAVEMAMDWCDAPRSPSPVDAWDQEKPALVYEDEVGTQPDGVFFTRGQSFFFQRSTASSSRSTARRSGF